MTTACPHCTPRWPPGSTLPRPRLIVCSCRRARPAGPSSVLQATKSCGGPPKAWKSGARPALRRRRWPPWRPRASPRQEHFPPTRPPCCWGDGGPSQWRPPRKAPARSPPRARPRQAWSGRAKTGGGRWRSGVRWMGGGWRRSNSSRTTAFGSTSRWPGTRSPYAPPRTSERRGARQTPAGSWLRPSRGGPWWCARPWPLSRPGGSSRTTTSRALGSATASCPKEARPPLRAGWRRGRRAARQHSTRPRGPWEMGRGDRRSPRRDCSSRSRQYAPPSHSPRPTPTRSPWRQRQCAPPGRARGHLLGSPARSWLRRVEFPSVLLGSFSPSAPFTLRPASYAPQTSRRALRRGAGACALRPTLHTVHPDSKR
mmetsp:Transcript_40989/g.131047  ORF Transcript_40989/g.131047 Transcript_40989/m.131047 type:complete len:370 (-) Transcript_40989:73-1182(-)